MKPPTRKQLASKLQHAGASKKRIKKHNRAEGDRKRTARMKCVTVGHKPPTSR